MRRYILEYIVWASVVLFGGFGLKLFPDLGEIPLMHALFISIMFFGVFMECRAFGRYKENRKNAKTTNTVKEVPHD